jgi:hypothetical protein
MNIAVEETPLAKKQPTLNFQLIDSKNMANLYRLQEIFKSIQDSDTPYIHADYAINKTNGVAVLVNPNIIEPTEGYIFSHFLTALEVDVSIVDNFGFASYEDDKFSGHCPAWFGIRDDKMGLVIGAASEKFNSTDIFIPCEVEEKEIDNGGKKKIKKWVYTLNGTPIDLIEGLDNDNKPTGKFYIQLVHHDEYDEYVFTFPFLIKKKDEDGNEIKYTSIDINKAWKTGEFSSILRTFGSGGSNVWLSVNKAFTMAFKDGSFPKGGVFILAKNGKYKFTPAGSHPNIKNDIHQADWSIVATSHPEMLVQYFDKEKNQHIVSLADATNIQFGNAKFNNEGYNWLDNYRKKSGADGYNNMVLLHIIEPAKNMEHTPVNTCTNIYPRIQNKLRQSPHLLAIVDTTNMQTGILPNGVRTAHSIAEYQQAKEDLTMTDYPTRPQVPAMAGMAETSDPILF